MALRDGGLRTSANVEITHACGCEVSWEIDGTRKSIPAIANALAYHDCPKCNNYYNAFQYEMTWSGNAFFRYSASMYAVQRDEK